MLSKERIEQIWKNTSRNKLNETFDDDVEKIKQDSISFKNKDFLDQFKMLNSYLDENYYDDVWDVNYRRIYSVVKNTENEKTKNILMYGRVQSGKTNNSLLLIDVLCQFDYELIFFLGGTTNDLLSQNRGRFDDYRFEFKNSNWLNFRDISEDEGFKNVKLQLNRRHLDDQQNELKILIPLLKQEDRLSRAIELIDELPFKDKLKIAVIDDESDVASTDKGDKKNEDEIKQAKISSLIDKILSFSNESRYVAVTATPSDNLLNVKLASTKRYVNYIIPLTNQNTYFGFNQFHKDSKEHLQILNETWTEKQDIIFFLEETIKICQEVNNNDALDNEMFSILINISVDKLVHKNNKEIVLKWINDKKMTANQNELDVINNLAIHVINSDGENKQLVSKQRFNIYIGGNSLSRGITFENLLTELILNYNENSKSSTMTQRCRWFGYREKVFPYMKIFMTQQLSDLYKNLGEIENEFFTYLKEGLKFNEEVANFYRQLYEERRVKF